MATQLCKWPKYLAICLCTFNSLFLNSAIIMVLVILIVSNVNLYETSSVLIVYEAFQVS